MADAPTRVKHRQLRGVQVSVSMLVTQEPSGGGEGMGAPDMCGGLVRVCLAGYHKFSAEATDCQPGR